MQQTAGLLLELGAPCWFRLLELKARSRACNHHCNDDCFHEGAQAPALNRLRITRSVYLMLKYV